MSKESARPPSYISFPGLLSGQTCSFIAGLPSRDHGSAPGIASEVCRLPYRYIRRVLPVAARPCDETSRCPLSIKNAESASVQCSLCPSLAITRHFGDRLGITLDSLFVERVGTETESGMLPAGRGGRRKQWSLTVVANGPRCG